MLHLLEGCEVRSSLLKLMIMMTHIKMMQIPYLDLINASLNKCVIQAIRITSLGCSKTCYT